MVFFFELDAPLIIYIILFVLYVLSAGSLLTASMEVAMFVYSRTFVLEFSTGVYAFESSSNVWFGFFYVWNFVRFGLLVTFGIWLSLGFD